MKGRLNTSRLQLVLADAPLLLACIEGRNSLSTALNIEVASDWPPEHLDEDALRWSLAAIDAGQAPPPWGFYLMVRREPAPLLIGTCGFKGGPDSSGLVEVGYSVVPTWQRQGYATEAVQALIDCAFDSGALSVAAETLPHLDASLKVMERCGMQPSRDASSPDVVRRVRLKVN